MSYRCFPAALAILALGLSASAAQLSGAAQSVMPASTRQVISIDYHRLAADPVAQQLEAQVLPPEMNGLGDLLRHGGLNPDNDLNRLTFAAYAGDQGSGGLIGIAEGNLGGLKLTLFYQKTAKQPNPPQIDGVNVYDSGSLMFFMADPSTLVFGSKSAVTQAIETQQGAAQLGQNQQLTDLIAGTQASDVWSVLDAQGARSMIHSMIGASAGSMANMIDQHFDGARYTIAFQNEIQVNLELMTTDALSAAAISTGLNAAIALRQKQEANPAAKSILNQIQVDSAGNNAFLQISSPESTVASLMKTDLMQTILH